MSPLCMTTGPRPGSSPVFFLRVLLLVFGVFGGSPVFAQSQQDSRDMSSGPRSVENNSSWLTVWSAAPQRPRKPTRARVFDGQSLRQIVPIGVGGDQVRVRFSNVYGEVPLEIGRAAVALQKDGSVVHAQTAMALRFSGRPSVKIAVGDRVVSDPVTLKVADATRLAVSLYLPGRHPVSTYHRRAFEESFVSAGDTTLQARVDVEARYESWFWLTGVDVRTRPQSKAIVVLGDSISDGFGLAVRENQPWPDVLQRRLLASGRDDLRHSVLNLGIGGNRLLNALPGFGTSLIERFDRDAIGRAGTQYVIVQIGINDIGLPVTPVDVLSLPEWIRSQIIDEADLIAGFQRIIEMSEQRGLKIIAATLLPYRGSEYFTERGERIRQSINDWIRREPGFDHVLDFDALLRDPSDPSRLSPTFDSGDHLHPGATGLAALANAIDLDLFSTSR